MTTQWIIRQEEARVRTGLSKYLSHPSEWKRRLALLAAKDINEQDVKHWAWIVEAGSGDEMIARFVSSDIHKPPFLLLMMLGRDKIIKEQKSFIRLLHYILEKYVQATSSGELQVLPDNRRPPLMGRRNLTPFHFVILLQRLTYHCRRLWPAAMVSVSHLAAEYIETIPLGSLGAESYARGYMSRNYVYNQALQLFRRRSLHKPLENMSYNWQAQRLLLSLGNKLEPKLLINKASLRAVRTVFLGLRKTESETRNAQRSSKTWPPYRKDWDGIDERRKPEETLSRSVKVGIEMQQAGYPADEIDRAAGALGGALIGQSPTTHTRSLGPRIWTGDKAALNVFSAWAARVRSTRNAQEAWRMFETPPRPGLKPNFQVYTEMFEKLFARAVPDEDSQVPGDSREVWTPYTGNLSKFEIIRLEPPSADEIYERMIHDGNRPVGRCLGLLIRNARSVEAGWAYLQDSPFKGHVKGVLDSTSRPSFESLKRIPSSILNAWIYLLCKRHTETQAIQSHRRLRQEDSHTRHAIKMVICLLEQGLSRSTDYRAAAHAILRALATHRTLYDTSGKSRNHVETLAVFLHVLRLARNAAGTDTIMFEQLSRMLRKTMRALTMGTERAHLGEKAKDLVKTAHSELVSIFHELTSLEEVKVNNNLAPPPFQFRNAITPPLLYKYLRAMAACGDTHEIIRIMEWILAAWDSEALFLEAKMRDEKAFEVVERRLFPYLARMTERGRIPADAIAHFRDGLDRLKPRIMLAWGEKVESKWTWPQSSTNDEADVDIDLDIAIEWTRV